MLTLLQACYFWNFGNAWPFLSKIIVSIFRKLHVFLQKINFTTHFFLKMLQKIANLSFWVIWEFLNLKWCYQFKETFDVYIQAKDQFYPSCFPWDITNILQTCYFGCFGHAWLLTLKVILSACRKLLCLHARKKSIWAKKNFFWKMAFSLFKYSNYLPPCQKLKKSYWKIPERNANWGMDRPHRQYYQSSVCHGSKKKDKQKFRWKCEMVPTICGK